MAKSRLERHQAFMRCGVLFCRARSMHLFEARSMHLFEAHSHYKCRPDDETAFEKMKRQIVDPRASFRLDKVDADRIRTAVAGT